MAKANMEITVKGLEGFEEFSKRVQELGNAFGIIGGSTDEITGRHDANQRIRLIDLDHPRRSSLEFGVDDQLIAACLPAQDAKANQQSQFYEPVSAAMFHLRFDGLSWCSQ